MGQSVSRLGSSKHSIVTSYEDAYGWIGNCYKDCLMFDDSNTVFFTFNTNWNIFVLVGFDASASETTTNNI